MGGFSPDEATLSEVGKPQGRRGGRGSGTGRRGPVCVPGRVLHQELQSSTCMVLGPGLVSS